MENYYLIASSKHGPFHPMDKLTIQKDGHRLRVFGEAYMKDPASDLLHAKLRQRVKGDAAKVYIIRRNELQAQEYNWTPEWEEWEGCGFKGRLTPKLCQFKRG